MKAFTGTFRLLRLASRRDRIVVPVTIFFAFLMVGATAPALAATYSTQEEILSYIVSSVSSVVGRIFQGPVQGADLGAILMAEVFLFGLIILGVMSIFIVTRHTRHNEETGAGELLGSTVLGRSSSLTAALLLAVCANIIAGLLIFTTLLFIPEFDALGGGFLAAALASFGIVMASVAALTAQLSDYRRGANLLAISVLGVFFVIRAFGDALGTVAADGLSVTASWVSWLSPMGWSYQVQPFAGNRVLPILMLLGLSVLLSGIAYFLMNKRDIGSSIFPSKAGSNRASQRLLRPFGLTNKLQKSNFLAWSAGFVVSGVLVAVIVEDFRSTFEENELFSDWIGGAGSSSFMESIIATMFPLLAAMLAGYVVGAVSKIQDEESSGRIEYLLGTALGRVKWLFTHISYTVVGSIVALLAMGAAGSIAYSFAADVQEIQSIDILWSAAVSIPAMLLFLSVCTLVYTAFGKATKAFAWTYYSYCAIISSLAGIFSLPSWTSFLSPFYHTPLYPSSDFSWTPLVIMLAVTGLLLLLCGYLFRKRSLLLH